MFRCGAIAESSSWLALWKLFMSYLRSLHLSTKIRPILSSIVSDRQKT
ncbi:hypothetical protein [Nostoc sp.]